MVFIKISQNSQENTWVSFLIKWQANIFLTEHLGQLTRNDSASSPKFGETNYPRANKENLPLN